MAVTLSMEGPVAILRWDDGENRVHLDSLHQLNAALDELEAVVGPLAVVVTGAGRFFCNGVDLDRVAGDERLLSDTIHELRRTLARILLFPAYCVAALNGHAFGAGAVLTCAFDARVMREDRGYWSVNEGAIGFALDEGLWSLLAHRLESRTATEAALTARRYDAADALRAGIVEVIVSEDRVLPESVERAGELLTVGRDTLAHHKRLAHGALAEYLCSTDVSWSDVVARAQTSIV